MFETSVVRIQDRAPDRRLGLLTLSVAAHAAIIIAIVAAGLASVNMPNQAPMQMTIPVFRQPPPALGMPDAGPTPKPPTAQPAQTQRAPLPQTVVAPNVRLYGLLVVSALVSESLLAPIDSGPSAAVSAPLTSMPESAVTAIALA